jgi:hypothetical protein
MNNQNSMPVRLTAYVINNVILNTELKVHVPFQHFLEAVKTLTKSQRAKLQHELSKTMPKKADKKHYIDVLLNGLVFTEQDIQIIEENCKSIREWRKPAS